MDTRQMRLEGVKKAVEAAGNRSKLARALGIKVQSIQQWTKIPDERLIEVEAVTGVPRAELRPDIFGEAKAA